MDKEKKYGKFIDHDEREYSKKPMLVELDGEPVWATFVGDGSPATTVRKQYYSSLKSAEKASVSDQFNDPKSFRGFDHIRG